MLVYLLLIVLCLLQLFTICVAFSIVLHVSQMLLSSNFIRCLFFLSKQCPDRRLFINRICLLFSVECLNHVCNFGVIIICALKLPLV